ncbi:MAG: hypothetical protein LUF92_13255 [Clostridiales bacterium]|nr:hypothetical protein [Clostridiales bacterium]
MFRRSEIKIVVSIMAAIVFLMVGTISVIYFLSYKDVYDTDQEMLKFYISSYEQNGNPKDRQNESDVSDEDKTIDDAQEDRPTSGEPTEDVPEEDELADGVSKEIMSTEDILEEDELADDFSKENMPTGDAPEEDMLPEGPPEERNELDQDRGSTYALSTFYSVALADGNVVDIDNNDGILYSVEELTQLAQTILNKKKSEGIYGSMIYRVETYETYSLVAMMDNTIMGQSVTSLVKYTAIFGAIAIVVTFFIAVFLAKQIVRPLRENHENQKQFISDAGHELKTPLAVMNTNIEVLSREIGDNPWLANIIYENERMTAIVRQLLDLSRTENDKPEMRLVDLSRIVMREVLSFEISAFEQGLPLHSESIEEDVFMQGNEEQLGRLTAILLDNAIEHSAPDGQIIVQLGVKGRKVSLPVSNAGEP